MEVRRDVRTSVWVKGTEIHPEARVERMTRRGWGTNFSEEPKDAWFHFSIPAPLVLEGSRPRLLRVYVLFRTRNALVTSVHVYDGPRLVTEFNELTLVGEHEASIDAFNFWTIEEPFPVFYGLGLSVQVRFLPDWGEVLFTAAGADFS